MDKAREVLKMFEGTHNFASFAANKRSRLHKKRDPDTLLHVEIKRDHEYFVRTVENIEIEKVPPPLQSHHYFVYDAFDFYVAKFTSQAFFHNQVRES